MPELPEARTIASGLDRMLAGKTIRSALLLRVDMLRTGEHSQFMELDGLRCKGFDTRGKYVVMHTRLYRLVIQLGMAGVLSVDKADTPLINHTHMVLDFSGGVQLRYRNTRRIASGLHLLKSGREDAGLLCSLGPDATDIDADFFVESVSSRRRPIKSALLDQSILAGLGNIYTDESLARAGISPLRRCDRIGRKRLLGLLEVIKAVLAEAIADGGSTLGDANPYVDAEGNPGSFAEKHIVYGRGGQPCSKCGQTLSGAIIGGRNSTWCPDCQS